MSEDIKQRIKEQMRAEEGDGSTASASDVSSGGDVPTAAKPSVFKRAQRTEIASFFRQFSVLIAAGYPLTRALELLSRATSNDDLAQAVKGVASQVESGAPIDRSMARYPWYFDPGIRAIMKSAEASGNLPEALEYLADMLEHDREVRDKLANALSYPFVLLGLAVAVIIVLLLFVVPEFAGHVERAGGELEGLAAAINATSEFIRTPWGLPIVVGSAFGIFFLVGQWRRRNELAFDRMLGRLPVLGRIMMLASLTRFADLLHMLTANGVALLDSLHLAKGVIANRYLRRAVDDMHASVQQGKGLSEPLRSYKNLPPIFVDMMLVAEESGKFAEVMGHLAKYMRAQLVRITDRFGVLIQPIMLILIGGIVLAIFLTFFLPYFDTLTALSKHQ